MYISFPMFCWLFVAGMLLIPGVARELFDSVVFMLGLVILSAPIWGAAVALFLYL